MSWQKSLSQFEQIGNAVPPRLAELIGECIIKMLDGNSPKADIADESAYEQLSFDLGISQSQEPKKHQARGKTHSNRGRNSKYSAIYTQIESMTDRETLDLPEDIDADFFTFVKGAMRRRNIEYEIIDKGGKKVLVHKGLKQGI